MTSNRTNNDKRLALAKVAICNTLATPSLAELLAPFGYTPARLREGLALHESAVALCQRQKVEYGDLQGANDLYANVFDQAMETYMRYVKVGRIALSNNRGAWQKLALGGKRKIRHTERLAQARQFYTNALSDAPIASQLAMFGITRAMLEQGQSQVEEASAADAASRQRAGAAKDATRERDVAVAALDEWIGDFMKVARVALRKRPQLLEMLGVEPKKRRAPAPAKGAAEPAAKTAEPIDVEPLAVAPF